MKCLEKVDAFLLTDANTPVIGEFCRSVRRLCNVKVEVSAEYHALLTPWGSQYALSEQYPNELGPWGEEYAIEALLPYQFDWAAFRAQVRWARTINDLLAMKPVSVALPVPAVIHPVVVDGEVVAPTKGKEEATATQENGLVPASANQRVGKNPDCSFCAEDKCKFVNTPEGCQYKKRASPKEKKVQSESQHSSGQTGAAGQPVVAKAGKPKPQGRKKTPKQGGK